MPGPTLAGLFFFLVEISSTKIMGYPITDYQLDLLCQYLADTQYIYYPFQVEFLKDLYRTGCRPEELLQYTRWTYISSSIINLTPLKGNSTRTFTASQLSESLLTAVINQIPPYSGLSLRQLNSITKKILPTPEIYNGDKSAIDYIFRYNATKILHNSGLTDDQIKDYFGWSTISMARGYYRAQITTQTDISNFLNNLDNMKILYSNQTVVQSTTSPGAIAYNYTIPANSLINDGDYIVIEAQFNSVVTTGSTLAKFIFSSFNIILTLPNVTELLFIRIKLIRKTASSWVYSYTIQTAIGSNSSEGYSGAAVLSSTPQTLSLKLQSPVSNQLTAYWISIELFNKPL